MPFGMVSGVGRRIGVLDGVEIIEREGRDSFGGKVGHHTVTNGNFVA